jgi:RNA polymerase sigma-B factor
MPDTQCQPLTRSPRVSRSARRQERELFKSYSATGDAAARDQLIRQCLPLARSLANRYARTGESADDLMQVASIGLIKAVDRFDPSRGTSFSSFAVPSIVGEIKRHFRDHGWAAHVPRALQERALKINAVAEQLTMELGRAPTSKQIAAAAGEELEDVLEAMEAATAQRCVSLDTPLAEGDDGSVAYAETIGELDARLEALEYRSVISGTIEALPQRERQMLAMRFGEDMTQSEIAARIGVSQMHVSRLIRRTLNRLSAVAQA